MNTFCHLHVHTQYSLLDGMIRLKDLIRKAKEYDMGAVAMTDHGNMFGAIDFYRQARAAGIKPIIGCEFYVAHGSRKEKQSYSHLTVLARNDAGYKNIMKLSSLSYLEGFYYKPRIDMELLRQHGEGLIILSGCLRGSVASHLLAGDYVKAANTAVAMRDIVGEDHFFIELMETGFAEQAKANDLLIRMARKEGFKLVATNDCHYLNKEDAKAHEVLTCIQTGKTLADEGRMRLETDQFYFKSPDEMAEAFKLAPDAIKNTVLIADMCDVTIELGKTFLPGTNSDKSPEEELTELAEEGFLRKIPKAQQAEYRPRLDYELAEIKRMGYPGYFLIVADFIRHAREKGIPVGPGRGSAAGSLVAYTLDITDVDPIRYELFFERFLNPERKSLPDIDTDFSPEGRGEIFAYLVEKYGQDRVSQIATFGRMQAKMVVRDVGRAIGMPYPDADRLAKLIPDELSISIDGAIEANPALKEAIDSDPDAAQLFGYARKLEGLYRHMSTHAAGVVISDVSLQEKVPLCVATNDVVTQYDMKIVEAVGLVKFDLLGLKTLTVIHDAVQMIKENHSVDIDWHKIPLTDKKTYKLLASGDTDGVFQLESSGIRELLRKMKPNRIEDLIALVALYRPGPLQTGMDQEYVTRKHNPKKIKYDHELLTPILKETYGVILYQEQVMQIARSLAGYTMGQADDLRKSMGKKIAEMMAKEQPRFISGAIERGVPEDVAAKIWSQMETFAQYGFNKSHSTAYALIAYRTAYLKAHYPIEFMAALLTSENTDRDKIIKYLRECRNSGIEVLPPDINESGSMFTVANGKIRFGFAAVKHVGVAAVEAILEERKNGRFNDLYDFYLRCQGSITKTVVTSLVYSGAFDGGGHTRTLLARAAEEISNNQDSLRMDAARRSSGQMGLFDDDPNVQISLESVLARVGDGPMKGRDEILRLEKESLGFFISGHPFDECKEKLAAISAKPIADIDQVRSGSTCVTAGVIDEIIYVTTRKKQERMCKLILDDGTGSLEVLVFPEPFAKAEEIIRKGNTVIVEGEVKKEDDGIKMMAKNVRLFTDEPAKAAGNPGGGPEPDGEEQGPALESAGNPELQCMEEDDGIPPWDTTPTEGDQSAGAVVSYESAPDSPVVMPDLDAPRDVKEGYRYEFYCPDVISGSERLIQITMEKLRDILLKYPGSNPCLLYLSLHGENGSSHVQDYEVSLKGYEADGSQAFIDDVTQLLGKSRVKEIKLESRLKEAA